MVNLFVNVFFIEEVLIITTAAFKEIDDNIHHRMPLFINEEFSEYFYV